MILPQGAPSQRGSVSAFAERLVVNEPPRLYLHMDEAEHCGRVGFMHSGKLLAMGTSTALKASYLRGDAWDIATGKLVEGLTALNQLACVQQASMAGDKLHVITSPGECSVDLLMRTLAAQGVSDASAAPAEATLEDVFVSLARS